MADDVEEFDHVVTPWTVGQLRAVLAGLDDDTPILVYVAEEPGGQFVGSEQVVTGASVDQGTLANEDWGVVEVECEFPSGRYLRPRFPRFPR